MRVLHLCVCVGVEKFGAIGGVFYWGGGGGRPGQVISGA